ncbi:hypothetical protein FQA39_LY06899 [Lamprigera yunnana]|nr:hypothetical protein FQA39_LY06899 [Lamprigera yunnana]
MSDSDESDYIPDQEFESDISDSDEEFSDSESKDDFIEPRFFGDWKVVSDPFIDSYPYTNVFQSKMGQLARGQFSRKFGNLEWQGSKNKGCPEDKINAEKNFSQKELDCIATVGVGKSHIEKIITDRSTPFLPEDDQEFNKFLHCFFLVRDLQDENGQLKYDNIINHVQKFPRRYFGGKPDDQTPIGLEIATKATESCMNIPNGSTFGHTAVKAQNCIDKRMTELVKESS